MSGTVDKLSSLFSGNGFVGLVFEFDEFSDADNGRVASWIEENRESFIFKAEPAVSLPQVGDRFEIDGDFALEIRKRVFRVYGEAEPFILLQCAVIDELPCEPCEPEEDIVLEGEEENEEISRVKLLLEGDLLLDILNTKFKGKHISNRATRLHHILQSGGFQIYADVCQCFPDELLKLKGMGLGTFHLLQNIVSKRGLDFGMDLKKYGIKPKKIL